MGVFIRLRSGRYRLFLQGASEILTKKYTRHVVASKHADKPQDPNSRIETKAINETTKDNISRTISFYANQMLTIALWYRDFNDPGGHHRHRGPPSSWRPRCRRFLPPRWSHRQDVDRRQH
ncbi:hypothetical protein BJ322DRAFT_1044840 [Thelephora terrestris]|uniref:Uncharacterized protein n=1 Tax=Thelephora terrestris TaxID=56493 RepID=A0A9P6HLE9_9AGAM|nr:hypothetical protein BJ322DRAFT_1044840 [Thelephora terrestris]